MDPQTASTEPLIEVETTPQPEGIIATAVVDNEHDASTHFAFKHRIFSIEHCRFALNGKHKMPCFYIPMGELMVAIELAKLQQEFNIPADSVDAALLLKVQKGLNYVPEIRPGDSIPREILDGSASWSVEEHHKEAALARLQMELIFWLNGMREDMPPLQMMKNMQNSSKGRGEIRDAHAKMVQLLRLDDMKVSRDRLAQVARETTYIEALRERSLKLGDILQKLASFYTSFKKEAAFAAEVSRMQELTRRAAKQVNERFVKCDSVLKEILKVMNDVPLAVTAIRQVRDETHLDLKKWDDYFARWADIKIERNEVNEKLFRNFYRFLAENYMEQQSWGSGKKK
ncbi:MAG: hypothetical protein EB059_01385 [Alphaproteobacteria bacterium]|nr:hypothetical protein [Alphaproteobacteria bacterium]